MGLVQNKGRKLARVSNSVLFQSAFAITSKEKNPYHFMRVPERVEILVVGSKERGIKERFHVVIRLAGSTGQN